MRRGKASPKTSRNEGNTPKQIRSNIELYHRYRFISSNGAATGVSANSLLCAAGSFTKTLNTTVVSMFQAVKINRIEILTPPATQGATATCSIEWFGLANSPNREYSDTTLSVTTPAKVSCPPPPQSVANFWQLNSGTTICTLTAPTGSIIDVWLKLVMYDDDNAGFNQASSAVATAALGSVYYLSLDSNGTHYYTPVSLTTTT